jgi:hypothetical protein
MTRIYQSPDKTKGMRVLVVGAGRYPYAEAARDELPMLKDLTSVEPSVSAFLRRLLTAWREDLSMDLLSVDLLLSDPKQPAGATWHGCGLPGEVPKAVDPPTLACLDAALKDALDGAAPDEGLVLFFCGHGFFRTNRYFVLHDFREAQNPWSGVVDLTGLELGLRQKPPRTQFLFWDCCADIPEGILDALGPVGNPIIPPRASQISRAEAAYGKLSRFGVASSPIGLQAFGTPNAPSRFTEMLIEAIEAAGAQRRQNGIWWVDDRGIMDAIQTYSQRHPELENPEFYLFVTPFSSDAPHRIRFRKLREAPKSLLIAASVPRSALKKAEVKIMVSGAQQALFTQTPSDTARAIVYVRVPALQHYEIRAVFNQGAGPTLSQSCFADLPLAEPAEFAP